MIKYRETLWSELYEGSRPSVKCLKEAVLNIESSLDLALKEGGVQSSLDLDRKKRRKRILWRLDGGFGSEGNLQWLLERDYQVIAKCFSARRATKLAQNIKRWTSYKDVDLGEPTYDLDDVEKKIAEKMGFSATTDSRFKILEMHVDLDLEGYEDRRIGGQKS